MSMMIIMVLAAAAGGIYLLSKDGGLSFLGGGGGEAPDVPDSAASTPVPALPATPPTAPITMPAQDPQIILLLTQQYHRQPTPREICKAQCRRIDRKRKGWKCNSDYANGVCLCNCRRSGGSPFSRDDWWKKDWRYGHKEWEWRGGRFHKKIIVVTKKSSRWDPRKFPQRDWKKVENKPGSAVVPPATVPPGAATSALVTDQEFSNF